MTNHRSHLRTALVGVTWTALALACVVETEVAPPKPARSAPPAPKVVEAALGDASASEGASASRVAPPVPEAQRVCQVDADCAAVLRNGCCRDGLNEPINKQFVEAYQASFTCPVAHPICPMHLILDRRTPACDGATHACILVAPPP